jgi:hypothetical protein
MILTVDDYNHYLLDKADKIYKKVPHNTSVLSNDSDNKRILSKLQSRKLLVPSRSYDAVTNT